MYKCYILKLYEMHKCNRIRWIINYVRKKQNENLKISQIIIFEKISIVGFLQNIYYEKHIYYDKNPTS